mgnify:CR=1 FL=1
MQRFVRYMQRMKRELPFSIRFTPDLKVALQKLADRENRSLTNYVETVLREHVAHEEQGKRK